MEISSHIMKDIRVANKMRISDVMLCDKIKSFRFRWLRQAFQQLISHRKALILVANSLTQDHDYPPKAGSWCYLLKIWEKDFRWLSGDYQALISHRKALVSAA